MKLRCIMFGLVVLHALSMHGQTLESLDSVRNRFELEAGMRISEFEDYSQQAREEYEHFEAQARAEYEQYVASVKQVWGGDSIIENTRTEWVEYSNDYTSRSIVDFDNGCITLETAIDEIGDDAYAAERLTQAVEQLLNSRGSTHPYQMSAELADIVSDEPILDGIVDLSAYQLAFGEINAAPKQKVRAAPPSPVVKGKELNLPISDRKNQRVSSDETMAQKRLQGKNTSSIGKEREEARQQARQKAKARSMIKARIGGTSTEVNIADAASAIVAQSSKTRKKIKGGDGKERTVIQIEMPMATDYLDERAARYRHLVSEFSQKFQIEEPLIYAVIEQESRFNPQATSHIPAYGLMQLVPSSGGCDAFTYVKKLSKPQCPQPSYLYVPRNNIELGTAYLRILMNRFASVVDPDCRRLCVIAAYNTGEGNVSHSFIGKRATAKSIASHINALNYSQLYDHLTTRLSTSEARNYVSGVSKRREKYLK